MVLCTHIHVDDIVYIINADMPAHVHITYMYIHVHIVCLCTGIHICIDMHIFVGICMGVHVHVHIITYLFINEVYKYVYRYLCPHIYAHICTYVQTHVYICASVGAHTPTPQLCVHLSFALAACILPAVGIFWQRSRVKGARVGEALQ